MSRKTGSIKGQCQNCGTVPEGCSKGNMANWKSTQFQPKRMKCAPCSKRHRDIEDKETTQCAG